MSRNLQATLRWTTRLSAGCGKPRETAHLDTLLVEPEIELAGIEAHEPANLEEWDPPLGHETPDMPARDPERLGNAVDIQKWVANVCPWN